MQIDYILKKDFNALLPFKHFFDKQLSIFEDKKLVNYLFNNSLFITGTERFRLVLKLDEKMNQYIIYKDVIENYFVVEFGSRLWIYDEKDDVLISNFIYSNEKDPSMFCKEFLSKLDEQYNNTCKPLTINQNLLPLFDLKTDYLTQDDLLQIYRYLQIPIIINSESREEIETMFNISPGVSMQEFITEDKENLNDYFSNHQIIYNFKNLDVYRQYKLLERQKRVGFIIAGNIDSFSLPANLMDQIAIFTPKKDNFERIKLSVCHNTPPSSIRYAENKDNLRIHPFLVAYVYYLNNKNNENRWDLYTSTINQAKLTLASKVLYATRNPRALEPIFGERRTQEILDFSIKLCPKEELIKVVKKTNSLNSMGGNHIENIWVLAESEENFEHIFTSRDQIEAYHVLRSIIHQTSIEDELDNNTRRLKL